MHTASITLRRGRRSDFAGIMDLLAAAGLPVPPADRAALRRFRNIVGDLGADLYVAECAGALAGVVYITYTRQFTEGQQARLEHLAVAAAHGDAGVARALLDLAIARARKRACATLVCAPGAGTMLGGEHLQDAGLLPHATQHSLRLTPGDC